MTLIMGSAKETADAIAREWCRTPDDFYECSAAIEAAIAAKPAAPTKLVSICPHPEQCELRDAEHEATPAARWRQEGKSDPHGDRYDRERATLCCGHLTDDELANAVFLDPNIGLLTGAKDRIRWLSRQLEAAKAVDLKGAPEYWQELFGESYKPVKWGKYQASHPTTIKGVIENLKAVCPEAVDVIAALIFWRTYDHALIEALSQRVAEMTETTA